MKHAPKLDQSFIPFGVWRAAYLKDAKKPISIALERDQGQVSVHHTFIHGTPEMAEADYRYVERYVKFLLWSTGGFKVTVCGCPELTQRLKAAYSAGGERDFDHTFFFQLYEQELQIIDAALEDCPAANETPKPMGGHMEGCRIGFDAGGSDRKVSAVIDGETVYSEEVVWFPKLNADPNYQYGHIVEAFKTAASKMPRVDAIGVSSAGTFIGNAPMVASLFIKVPRSKWDQIKTIYDRAGAAVNPDAPVLVANDGDVSALAGAIGLGKGNLMGLAMGTSEAVGYVDADQNVLGWINELAFAPVDLQEGAMQDEWSLDYGVGCKYFSQDAVIKLCPAAGIELDESLSLAEKLKAVQKLMEADDPRAQAIFETIGAYFAYNTVMYAQIYDLDYIMLMGRVMSGKGGDTILKVTNDILAAEYPELAKKILVTLPDEEMRRVGQAVAAASLPKVK
jgi:predicted NBD/HSP70 family sugar kinase